MENISDILTGTTGVIAIGSLVIFIGIIILIARFYHRAFRGQALIRTGPSSVKVSFKGIIVVPVIHRLEKMDISLKTIIIDREGKDGLVCKDNLRADIKVSFFIKVNEDPEAVTRVAQSVGCARASSQDAIEELFEAKFSEALKTVGKRLDFVELYDSRDKLSQEIMNTIGSYLNGYSLEDVAIDYLEQTPISSLDENNILDSEGIKKIIDLTSIQKIKANKIEREQEKVITQQNVEAREAILELEKQLAETEEKQRREVETIKAREQAEIDKVTQEQRLKSEQARIATEEEVQVSEQNKLRQIVVAEKNKERTTAIETEKVEKDRLLEVTERERIVTLAQIEKEKAIENEKKNIQEIIRDRVAIEKTVVVEEELIKDTKAKSEADRNKFVAITKAEEEAEQALVQTIKAAEAAKQAAEFIAKQKLIDAEADHASATQSAEAIKIMAEAEAAKNAAVGMSEAQVMEAKAEARQKEGDAEAAIIEAKANADAKAIELIGDAQSIADKKIGAATAQVEKDKGLAQAEVIEATAIAEEKKGLTEATVAKEKYQVEASGIEQKAEAMKKLDGVGKDHEEFKLQLEKEKEIELAQIGIQKDIAEAQANVISNALQQANIDIVGGDAAFFDKIISGITNGKYIDRTVDNSKLLTDVKDNLLGDEATQGDFIRNVKGIISDLGIDSEDVKNLSIATLLYKMMNENEDSERGNTLQGLLDMVQKYGLGDRSVKSLGI